MLDSQSNYLYRIRMTDTPVPETYKFTWSYSSISTFEICPRKWWAEKVASIVPYTSNAAADWGTSVHEQLELRAQDGGNLPSNMAQYTPTLEKVRKLASIAMVTKYEHQMGMTADGRPCDFNAPDMRGRAITDAYFVLSPETAAVVDYKTGARYYGPTLQPIINAKLVFLHQPEVNHVITSWAYLKVKKTEIQDFYRHTIDNDFAAVTRVVDQMQVALDNQHFPAKRGFLCKEYCGDVSCPHNGAGRARYGGPRERAVPSNSSIPKDRSWKMM